MQFESTVRVGTFNAHLCFAINQLKQIFLDLAPGLPLRITSWNDSDHIRQSLHDMDMAVDIHSKDMTTHQKHDVLAAARKLFGNEYGIILEYEFKVEEHFHLQVGYEHLLEYPITIAA